MAIVSQVVKKVWRDLGEKEERLKELKMEWFFHPEQIAYYSPLSHTLHFNRSLASYASEECLIYIVWHELIHVKMVIDLMEEISSCKDLKRKRIIERRFRRLVTDEKYMHGRNFQALMRECPYGPDELNCLYENDLTCEKEVL